MKTRKLIPMLFSTPMVEAIGKGTKTQTRRVVKDIHPDSEFMPDLKMLGYTFVEPDGKLQTPEMASVVQCLYGQPGDIIWVRETFCKTPSDTYCYKAGLDMDSEDIRQDYLKSGAKWAKWKPNMHMPLRACRYFIYVNSVRVERLQDITEQDAIAEGIERGTDHLNSLFLDYRGNKVYASGKFNLSRTVWVDPISSYKSLWQSINGPKSWDANPWVFVVEFEVIGLDLMMAYFQDILESYDEKRRGKVHSDLLACMVRLSEKKEEGV